MPIISRRRRLGTTSGGGTVNRADAFTRADSAVSLGTPSDAGTAWAARHGTQGVQTNAAYQVATAGTLDSVTATLVGALSTLTCSPNGTFKVDVTRDAGNNGFGGIVFRWVDADDFFLALQNGNNIFVYKIAAGSATLLYNALSHNYPFTGFTNAIQVVLTASGYTVQTVDSVNGVQTEYGPIADTTGNASAEHGVSTNDTTIRLDNVSWTGA